ncbi:MAG: c-type cytochrome [Polyangiaceae bacterium]
MRIRLALLTIPFLAFSALFAACDGGGEGGELPACPEGGTALTYADFGQPFFGKYCTSCHSAGSGVSEAQDIPLDSQSAVQSRIEDIFEEAGGTHTGMPPAGNAAPTAAEREQLAEWLSCGAE